MVPLEDGRDRGLPRAIEDVRHPRRDFHLLGITRTELVKHYERYGVASFDSTSPFRQAFKDDRDNYYSPRAQVRRDPGHADRRQPTDSSNGCSLANSTRTRAARSSRRAWRRSRAYDRDECSIEAPLEALAPTTPSWASLTARPSTGGRSQTGLGGPVRAGSARRSASTSSSSAAPSATSDAASTTCSSSTTSYIRNSPLA